MDPPQEPNLTEPRTKSERTRTRILDAAAAVFSEQGYGARLSDIARHAGIQTGSLYYHFSSREELVDERRLVLAVDELADSAAAEEQLPVHRPRGGATVVVVVRVERERREVILGPGQFCVKIDRFGAADADEDQAVPLRNSNLAEVALAVDVVEGTRAQRACPKGAVALERLSVIRARHGS
ncbi:MAG: TetR family transcriptional regulator [Actinobacteria bacterium]|nr:TetR family transcriptional regulator [Actinomycetota bacterium]MSX21227.1 TetR family transcriptional regulator [Actinomycetota bacterium]MSY11604.1 TetR family transcriptional regulator [Actinomycetota bacterium]MSZ04155.1 TetR family transcriptional regulator [Actinomycetota bacterium]MTB07465.1 TetR family transcriptional regulator [Actinomycetota bacterium]